MRKAVNECIPQYNQEQQYCGPDPDNEEASWTFYVDVPPNQILGRVHVIGSGNHTIWISNAEESDFSELQNGERIDDPVSAKEIRIEIDDGCIAGAIVDVNDPQLLVSGSVTGSVSGLSQSASYIRFAIGDELVHSEAMEMGDFSFSVFHFAVGKWASFKAKDIEYFRCLKSGVGHKAFSG